MNLKNLINFKNVGYPFSNLKTSKEPDTLEYHVFEATQSNYKNLLLIIDPQNDFMEDGALPVKGSRDDILNLVSFIYNNMQKIDKINISLDTHKYHQIFHPAWWTDEKNNHPDPYTVITKDSKYKPLYEKEKSLKYVNALAKTDKELVIWPYHCILGTYGHNIEPNLENVLSYYASATGNAIQKIIKGTDPLSEMYGIFRPEYSENIEVNYERLAKDYGKFQNIYIAGEAKSHCVLESVKQLCELYAYEAFNPKIYILDDCTSSIKGFEEETEKTFVFLEKTYRLELINSHKAKL